MPGFLFQVGASASCPHGGQVLVTPVAPRAFVGPQPVATALDRYTVVGCPFNVGSSPHPCVSVQWTTPALRVLVGGRPAVLQTSTGLCLAADLAPQGVPIVAATQPRVMGA